MYQNSRAGGPTGDKLRHIVACDIRPQVVKSVAPEIIAGHAWDNMGYSSYDKDTKNDCSCESTHDQAQPKERDELSGFNGEAQRQDLLRSPGYLSRWLPNHLRTREAAELRSCLLDRDSRRRDSLRLDRGPQRTPPVHQAGAQDAAPAGFAVLDGQRGGRAGQERRPAVRYRTSSNHRSFRSCPIGQLKFLNSTGDKQRASSYKRQATGVKRPALQKNFSRFPIRRLAVGGWAHRLQARGSRIPDKD